jgi:hypothetical protein
MTDRYFPDDHEVDQWLSSYTLDGTDANPVLDQLQAATADSVNRFRGNAPGLVANGFAHFAYLDVPDHDRSKIRGAVRQAIAAESVGIISLCPHTQQIRPQVLMCDPPVIVCTACLPGRRAAIEAVGHVWNHECDTCGVRVEQLTRSRSVGLASSPSPAMSAAAAPPTTTASRLNTQTRS